MSQNIDQIKMSSPHGQNIVVYDLEIKRSIGQNGITWNDHDKMGISVGVAYWYKTGEFYVFMDDNIEELPLLLNQAEIVSGFNVIQFDHKVLNGTTVKNHYTNFENTYDLLVESRIASGWKEGSRFPSGMRLDDHLESTFGKSFMKTEDGADAPKFWQNMQFGKLISYCIADVKRECALFEHVWRELPVKSPQHPERVLRHPLRPRKERI